MAPWAAYSSSKGLKKEASEDGAGSAGRGLGWRTRLALGQSWGTGKVVQKMLLPPFFGFQEKECFLPNYLDLLSNLLFTLKVVK